MNQTPKLKVYAKLNKHINFKKERDKSSARKTPTQVTCCKCRQKFVLPFKPRNPEVYCDECWKKKKILPKKSPIKK
ncbi:MAG: hypothetical protein ACP5N3_02855 [Candidatus Nanoarchaeia archaeon]